METPDAAVAYYAVQQALARRTAETSAEIWKTLDTGDLDGSWRGDRVGERLYVTVSAMQATAASPADRYLDEVLTQQGISSPVTGRVQPRSLAGVASDGRPLETLLYQPVITTKTAMGEGLTAAEAMARGQARLAMLVATQVQDTGRLAVSVGMTARPAVTGYIRMLVPPSCARCVVLAGAFYRWNRGFQRHPMCDCRHIPSTEGVGGDLTTDPNSYFESLDQAQQDRIFTKSGAEAIRDGADVGQVVNARRGMRSTVAYGRRVATTTAGRTARGTTGPRLMPEQIYREAAGNRDEAILLLSRHGYLI